MTGATPARGGWTAERRIIDTEAAVVLDHPERGLAGVIAGCAAQGVTIDAIGALDAIERVSLGVS